MTLHDVNTVTFVQCIDILQYNPIHSAYFSFSPAHDHKQDKLGASYSDASFRRRGYVIEIIFVLNYSLSHNGPFNF